MDIIGGIDEVDLSFRFEVVWENGQVWSEELC
jgi:hypothetical protein